LTCQEEFSNYIDPFSKVLELKPESTIQTGFPRREKMIININLNFEEVESKARRQGLSTMPFP